MNSIMLRTCALAGAILAAASSAQSQTAEVGTALQALERAARAPLRTAVSPTTGLATFIGADRDHPIPISMRAAATAEKRARAFLGRGGAAFGISTSRQLVLQKVSTPDEAGMEHVKFQQVHKGLSVRGGELTVHLRGAGVVAVNARTVADVDKVNTTPTVRAAAARHTASQMLAAELKVAKAKLTRPRLEIVNPGHFTDRRSASQLAWFVEATAFAVRELIWVDAHSGAVIFHFSQLTPARDRQVYSADNTSDLPGRLVRSEGDPPTGDADADAAYDYSGDTYDYYFGEHGRDSFDAAGGSLISTVQFCDYFECPYGNAFWDGAQVVYGEGFSRADDVDAHELTHAVTEHSAGLAYCLQSGALNESFSDIFGETVDLANNAGTDTVASRWLMGEDVPGLGAVRNMSDPNQFGDPAKVTDPRFVCYSECYSPDNGGVHTNSGVPNHAYTLMVDGGSYNGFTITGIGLTKAGSIQYRALTQYLTSTSTFIDDYNALLQSCSDLVGVAGISAADCTEVGKALDAVELEVPPCPVCGDGTVSPGEQCDDSNQNDGDGCDSNCTITGCGNGIVTAGEQCDDGNSTAADGCESDCTLSPGCRLFTASNVPRQIPDLDTATSTLRIPSGGPITHVEVVDLVGRHTYLSDLEFTLASPQQTQSVIIDHVCDGDEDFDLSLADTASDDIPCPATDAKVHMPSNPLAVFNGESAGGAWTLTVADQVPGDGGVLTGWGLLLCTPTAECGNGIVEGDEQCDDANTDDNDGCSSRCQDERVPGGGHGHSDCLIEWRTEPVTARRSRGLPQNRLQCTDDSPECDFGTTGDGACTFHVAQCLGSADARIDCPSGSIDRVDIRDPRPEASRDPIEQLNRVNIEDGLAAIGGTVSGTCAHASTKRGDICPLGVDSRCDSTPGSGDGVCAGRFVNFDPPVANVCTGFVDVVVPLRQTGSGLASGMKRLRLRTTASGSSPALSDEDSLTLICKPRPRSTVPPDSQPTVTSTPSLTPTRTPMQPSPATRTPSPSPTPTGTPPDGWTPFVFGSAQAQTLCSGARYVRYLPTYGKWVGVSLCSATRYKLFLGNSLDDTFHEIGDYAGHGQDHCELVNPNFRIPNEDDITSGGCSTCNIDSAHVFEPPVGSQGWSRATFGQPFTFVSSWPMYNLYTAQWYECGVSVP